MRKPIIAGNWKMNTTLKEALVLARGVRSGVQDVDGVETVVCPPFISVAAVSEALAASRVAVGAQDVHWEEKGAFTGEIAPGMLEGLVSVSYTHLTLPTSDLV